ncbi:MAG: DUF2975 domain-containing protein [Clostridia bacterium]
MKNNLLSRIMEKLSLVILILGILTTATLPLGFRWLLTIWEGHVEEWLFRNGLIVLYPVGILSVIAVWNMYVLMRNVNQQQPFIMDNAKRIKRIAALCVAEAILFFVAIFMLQSPTMMIVSIAVAVFSCYLFVMGKLFKQAVLYKEENDLTV